MNALLGFLTAFACTPVLAHFARRGGWIDRREGLEERKPRTEPVPPVGGAALLLACLVIAIAGGPALPWPALLAAFALGSLDDRLPAGLTPAQKLLGQVVVAALLGSLSPLVGRDPWALFLLALVAMNAVNTWDNADGAAAGLALVGFAGPGAGPLAGATAGATAGFLPWNLARRPGRGVPFAYLGDAGSHLVGVLVAAVPGAAWVLVLPLLDLARLSILRCARGSRPWVGDRCHLAHRLEQRGWPSRRVALVLALAAGPPVWGRLMLGWSGGLGGALVTLAIFTALVRGTRAPCSLSAPSR